MKNLKYKLLGAIAGDIAGSSYEFTRNKAILKSWPSNKIELFPTSSQFTDDTVCTCAIADSLINNVDLVTTMQKWCRKYRNAGYGGRFGEWIDSTNPEPYNSWGNGSAMRVSAVGWYANNIEECVELATKTAEITHNHSDGIKGAIAIAKAIYYAVNGYDKYTIKKHTLSLLYPEWSNKTLNDIKPTYSFDVSCQGSVPVALICFLESENYEDCLQKAISLCGDSDTIAAMAGGIAYPYYNKMTEITLHKALSFLNDDILDIIEQFDSYIDGR